MKQYNKALFVILILAAATVCATTLSCKKTKSSASSGPPTLYDTLGGSTLVIDPNVFSDTPVYIQKGYLAIRTIVDTTMFVFASDPLIDTFFNVLQHDDSLGSASEYISLSTAMTKFIATAAGDTDSTYMGPSMYWAHNPDSNSKMPLQVTDSAFNEFVYDLSQSAIDYGLSAQVVSQFGSMLYKYEGQIVQH